MARTQIDKSLINTVNSSSLVGTTTNNDAAAGIVGEYISADGSVNSNFVTTGTWEDYTSISLTAGDWDVWIVGSNQQNGATWTGVIMGIGTTSGNNAPANQGIQSAEYGFASSSTTPTTVPHSLMLRFSLASTTTIYYKRLASWSAGTPRTQRGRIAARRVR